MIEISVVVPAKNEEKNIVKCLNSLNGFSDIIVVDSESSDNTKELAARSGATVIDFHWNGRYPKKRNWVLQNYSFKTDWVLFLDADEFLTDNFKREVNLAITNKEFVGYWLTYNNYFQGRLLKHGVPMTKLALFRIDAGEYEKIDEQRWSDFDMEIHEHPVLTGNIGHIQERIIHNDYKGLHHFIAKHNEYSSWEAQRYYALLEQPSMTLTRRQKIKYSLLKNLWWPPLYFFYNYIIKLGFLDGKEGFSFSVYKAIYFFEIRSKILELERLKVHPIK